MQNRPSHVIVAEFEVRPECYEKFVALARRFSVECVESEPGCWQFDVVELATPPNGVLFYEAYDDVAAFEAHCRTPHLAAFRDAFFPAGRPAPLGVRPAERMTHARAGLRPGVLALAGSPARRFAPPALRRGMTPASAGVCP